MVKKGTTFYRRGISNNNFVFGSLTNANLVAFNISQHNLNLPKINNVPTPTPTPPTPPTIPNAPSLLTAEITSDNSLNTITLTSSVPYNGGSPITSYIFTNETTGVSQTEETNSSTFTGLSITTAYRFSAVAVNSVGSSVSSSTAHTAYISSVTTGNTAFLANMNFAGLAADASSNLLSVEFSIAPKTGSTTEPISATYYLDYLIENNLVNFNTNTLTLPIFGLYASSNTTTNTVTLTANTVQGFTSTYTYTITTTAWNDTSGLYTNPTITTARNNSIPLTYSLFLMKNITNAQVGPIIIDVDAEVRWISQSSPTHAMSLLTNKLTNKLNEVFIGINATLQKIDLPTATETQVINYTNDIYDINNDDHHNIDYGKYFNSMLIDCNTGGNTLPYTLECVIIESDVSGNIIRYFNFSNILSTFIFLSGDNPFQIETNNKPFIPLNNNNNSADWFHNNAACYWPTYNEFVASSRENAVFAIDYDNPYNVKWILGDLTKAWYTLFPNSLAQKALIIQGSGIYPIGQHSVEITPDDNLILFDNGLHSFNQVPAGLNRNYSAGRVYFIDRVNMHATEIFTFNMGETISSTITSSFYAVGTPDNTTYLANFASASGGPILIGVDASLNIAFNYHYPRNFLTSWNALPVSFNNLQFVSQPINAPSTVTNVTAVASNKQAVVSWKSSIGTTGYGAPLTYTVVSTPSVGNVTVSSINTSALITGLTNGTTYTFKVYASNSYGNSVNSSASNSVTPNTVTNGCANFSSPGNSVYYYDTSFNILPYNSNTFTIEAWIYMTQSPVITIENEGPKVTNFVTLIGDTDITDNTGTGWRFGVTSNRNLSFYWYTGGFNTAVGNQTIPLNVWTHIAICVDYNFKVNFFINGIKETNLSGTTTMTNRPQNNHYIWLGQYNSYGPNYQYGYLGGLRIVNYLPVYSGNFTVPNSPFSNTQPAGTNISAIYPGQTTFLLNMPNNSNYLNDTSVNAYSANIIGTVNFVNENPFT